MEQHPANTSGATADGVIEAYVSTAEMAPADASALRMLAAGDATATQRRRLARMVGDWRVTGRWGIRPGEPMVAVDNRARNEWQLFGQFLCCSMLAGDGRPVSTATYGFDPRTDEYFCVSMNALSPMYDVERGSFDENTNELILTGVELVMPIRLEVRYRRTIEFVDDDTYTLRIDYPGGDPAWAGLFVTHERIRTP